jgi:glutaredoxin
VFGAFTEGLQLFASFAMLLNFPRFNKMKGMGQIVTWSVRDETLHCENIIKLFKTFINENIEIWDDSLKKELYDACRTIVEHEDAFIDLAFEMGEIEGMTAESVKNYIRFIADRRLIQLGLKPNYGIKENPLPWIDVMLNSPEKANFFEQRATEYSKAATQGTWDDAFEPKEYTIFGQEGCPYCVKAKNLANKLQLDYKYIDLSNEAKLTLYNEYDVKSVPIILEDDELVGGYQEFSKLVRGF